LSQRRRPKPAAQRVASLVAEMLFQVLGGSLGLLVERHGSLSHHAQRYCSTRVDLAALALRARGLRGFGFANWRRCGGGGLLQLRNLRLQLREPGRAR